MTIKLVILTIATLLVAVTALMQPWRERDWGMGAAAGALLSAGYVLAFLLIKHGELQSPIRLIEKLTRAIISLLR